MGHDKKTIDQLFNSGKSVKLMAEQLLQIAERIETKSKVHGMAAQILLSIEKIEL